jgi:flagellar basal body-associated protein FliL
MIAQYFTQPDLQVGIILVLLGSGLVCLLAGILILIGRSFSGEMRTMAATSTELSKRAISHDMTSLASTTTDLLSTINDLMKTAAGTGAFLIVVGVVMMAAAYWLTNGLI